MLKTKSEIYIFDLFIRNFHYSFGGGTHQRGEETYSDDYEQDFMKEMVFELDFLGIYWFGQKFVGFSPEYLTEKPKWTFGQPK